MILVINNHGQFTHLIHRALRDLDIKNRIVPNDTSISKIKDKANGIILSGGPDIERTGLCRDYIKELNIPILGICLGHQLIADTLGGKIGPGSSGGYADIELDIIDNDKLFDGLGNSISIWASHADEVKSIPDGFDVLAESKICEIEAMKDEKDQIFGIQGHPEVAHTPKGDKILMNFIDVCNL